MVKVEVDASMQRRFSFSPLFSVPSEKAVYGTCTYVHVMYMYISHIRKPYPRKGFRNMPPSLVTCIIVSICNKGSHVSVFVRVSEVMYVLYSYIHTPMSTPKNPKSDTPINSDSHEPW